MFGDLWCEGRAQMWWGGGVLSCEGGAVITVMWLGVSDVMGDLWCEGKTLMWWGGPLMWKEISDVMWWPLIWREDSDVIRGFWCDGEPLMWTCLNSLLACSHHNPCILLVLTEIHMHASSCIVLHCFFVFFHVLKCIFLQAFFFASFHYYFFYSCSVLHCIYVCCVKMQPTIISSAHYNAKQWCEPVLLENIDLYCLYIGN